MTPLTISDEAVQINTLIVDIVDAKGRKILKGLTASLAHEIVDRFNSHTALVEALEACRHRLHCTQCGELTCWECLAADEMAQKALKQAKGGA